MSKTKINLILPLLVIILLSTAYGNAKGMEVGSLEYDASLIQDLEEREMLAETDVPKAEWYTQESIKGWGPMPRVYPGVGNIVKTLPKGINVEQWKRDRVVAIAKHYIGLPYRHHHIPGWNPQEGSKLNPLPGKGLDCSNFTAWVYNFGFGISLHGDVELQSKMLPRPVYSLPEGVRMIEKNEGFLPGDLLYIYNQNKTAIAHVVIYIDENHIIDSTGTHVAIRAFSGWYLERLSHAIRIFA